MKYMRGGAMSPDDATEVDDGRMARGELRWQLSGDGRAGQDAVGTVDDRHGALI
jgi:hypothetical protein